MSGSREVEREVLLAFWKVHILHHAGEEAIIGQGILRELRRHGYEVSPGTLYPILARMQERGWLRCRVDPRGGPRARKEYTLTREGREVLAQIRKQIEELYTEVVLGEEPEHGRAANPAREAKKRGAPALGRGPRARRRTSPSPRNSKA